MTRARACVATAVVAIVAAACRSSSENAHPTAHVTANVPSITHRAEPVAPAARAPAAATVAPFEIPKPSDAGMSKRDARRLAEQVVKQRLNRDLPPADYERLTDAILQLRTAARAMRGTEEASAEQARQRLAMQQALTEIQTITGLSIADLAGSFDDDAASGR